jgi:hypothetical protein
MHHLRRVFFATLLATLLFSASGCRHEELGFAPAAVQVPAQTEFIKTELYFGLSKPGGIVSEDEWGRFVDQQITPAFKEGLTILDAHGQWQNDKGSVIKEGTKLLILIHKPDREKSAAIEAIINQYKKQFQQESVLRVTTPAGVSF